MKIEDIFEFADHRIVFAGTIAESIDFIGPCVCELWIDQTLVSTFRAEPEMLPLRRQRSEWRAVSATGPLGFDLTEIRNHLPQAFIKCIGSTG